MLRLSSLIALALTLAGSSAFAADRNVNVTWHWTWVPDHTVGISDTVFSDIGIVRGVADGDDGSHVAVICTNLDYPGGASAGSCLHTDADGDKWISSFTCTPNATALAGVLGSCSGTGEFNGGTGKFASAKISSTFTPYVTDVLPDGSATGYTEEKQTIGD